MRWIQLLHMESSIIYIKWSWTWSSSRAPSPGFTPLMPAPYANVCSAARPKVVPSMRFYFIAWCRQTGARCCAYHEWSSLLSLGRWFREAWGRHHRQCLHGVSVTLVGQGLFVDIEDKSGRDISDIGVDPLLLVIIDTLQVVLKQLLSQSCISPLIR